MSTKIYNGFIFRGMNLNEVFGVINRARDVITAKQNDLYKQEIYRLASITRDRMAMGESFEDICEEESKRHHSSPVGLAYETVNEIIIEIERTKERMGPFDFESSITLHPVEDDTLAILFCENRELRECILSELGAEDYGYWDNADPEEEISEQEWKKRGEQWNKTLPNNRLSIPAFCGLTAEITEAQPRCYAPELKECEINDTRSSRIDYLTEKLYIEHYKEKVKHDGRKLEYGEWKRSDEGQVKMAETKSMVSAKVRNYNVEELWKNAKN